MKTKKSTDLDFFYKFLIMSVVLILLNVVLTVNGMSPFKVLLG